MGALAVGGGARVLAAAPSPSPSRRWLCIPPHTTPLPPPRALLARSCGVSGPPGDFSYREEVASITGEIVAARWPELMDIVRDGSLVVVGNPDPGENREPELVILVGTAHVSRISAEQVERTIKAVRPDNVVVELCKSRVGIMYMEPSGNSNANLLSLTGIDRNAAMSRSIKLGGRSALFLRLLLASVSEKISKSAPVPIGEEFRAARRAAKEVGAQLVLGDRPIEITFLVVESGIAGFDVE